MRLISSQTVYTSKCLLVAENHLGIIKLVLTDSPESLAVDDIPGTWWRTIRFGGRQLTIDTVSDVSCSAWIAIS